MVLNVLNVLMSYGIGKQCDAMRVALKMKKIHLLLSSPNFPRLCPDFARDVLPKHDGNMCHKTPQVALKWRFLSILRFEQMLLSPFWTFTRDESSAPALK